MAIAGYLGFKGGTFTFGGLVGVAVSGILISLPGMVIGTVVAVVRRPHLARAADARTENALLHLIVQLAITAVFWISFFYLAEYVFSTPDRMFEAVRTGDLKQAESLIQYNHDLALSRTYPGGSTPLHEAVSLGRRDIAELLLSKGDQVNARNYMHRTPLHIAAATGSKSMVELLLANKADVNVRDERGEMPLHRATLGLDKDIFRILLVNGADINAKGYNGWTPLYYAAGYCQHEVTHQAFTDPQTFVEFLLDNNADVNARDGVGETPLHAAVRCGSRGVVELLLNHHADVNARARIGLDVSGMTPLALAATMGQQDMVELLHQHGASR
jgi:ankyrin repeat protein